jgi:putative intracellular protease/amidase
MATEIDSAQQTSQWRAKVERRAYSNWEKRGRAEGSSHEDWFAAERSLAAAPKGTGAIKILIVTTSNDKFGPEGHPTGVWLEEFTDPYMEFVAGGVDIVVASPKGGQMPIDPRTLPNEQQKVDWAPAIAAATDTVPLSWVDSADFDAIFLPGGHGPMFDLPENDTLHRLVREFHDAGKVISAVCHGPAGIVNVRGADGEYLVKGVTLTSYTFPEEVAAKLDDKVPFILENRLREHGANFIRRENRADHVERDGLFITGQNPWSSKSIARSLMATLRKDFQPLLNVVATEKLETQTIAEFEAPSFIENLAVSTGGKLAVSALEEGAIYCIPFDDKPIALANLPKAAGLIWLDKDTLLAASTQQQASGLYRVRTGVEPELVVAIPDAKLLNGLTHLGGSKYLVADSYQSCIWCADVHSGLHAVWLSHPLLAHAADPFHPVPEFPGVNGIKKFGDTVYASSTEQQKLIAIKINADLSAGEPQVFMTLINIDDFAFDTHGNLYGATHIYNSVVRISSDRRITVIAGLEEGMAGSTAVAFGRTPECAHLLYVTTNGGMSAPPSGGVQPGRVLQIATDKLGYYPEEI